MFCGMVFSLAGKLEELKAEQAEHDSTLKALRKEKEQATKVIFALYVSYTNY